MPTKVLKLPIMKLFAAKVVTTKGQKRGTRYFAAGTAPKAAKPARAPSPAKGPNAATAERMARMRAAREAKRVSG